MDLLSEKRKQNNQERLGVTFRDHSGHRMATGVVLFFLMFFFSELHTEVERVVRRERLHAALAQLDAMPAMLNDLEKTGLKGG